MSIAEKSLEQLIDHLAEGWMQMQSKTSQAQMTALLAELEQRILFIHPISFLKCMILQLHHASQPSYKKLLEESYRYQRVPTQHVNDYCFGRSLKYLCMDSEFRLSENISPKAGNIVISSTTQAYTHINWAICGSNGQLYQVNDLSNEIIVTSLDQDHKLIHIIEISDLQLNINADSIWSYYTSPYVRSALSS